MLKGIGKLEDRTELVFSNKRITEGRVRRFNTCLIKILRWENQIILSAGLKKTFTPRHEITKMQSIEDKEVTLKPSREKWPITSNGTKMRQTCDFATAKKSKPEEEYLWYYGQRKWLSVSNYLTSGNIFQKWGLNKGVFR